MKQKGFEKQFKRKKKLKKCKTENGIKSLLKKFKD